MRRKKGKILTGKKGTTMAEVLVAFLVVMLMMALFSRVVVASLDLMKKAQTQISKTEKFNEKYYMTVEREKRLPVDDGNITLVLDVEKTSPSNLLPSALSIPLSKSRVLLYSDSEDTQLSRYSVGAARETETEGE